MNPTSLVLLIFLYACPALVVSDTNVTVDDFDRTRIIYSPQTAWIPVSDLNTLDRYLQSTTFTYAQFAFATFKFTGASAIYYMGYGADPVFSSGFTIEIRLDGQTVQVPENNDPQHRAQQILFSNTSLDPSIEHTIIVRKTSPSDGHQLNIDAFIYTIPDPAIAAPNAPSTIPVAALAGGVVGGVVGGGLLVALVIWLLRRRRNSMISKEVIPQHSPVGTSSDPSSPRTGTTSTPMSSPVRYKAAPTLPPDRYTRPAASPRHRPSTAASTQSSASLARTIQFAPTLPSTSDGRSQADTMEPSPPPYPGPMAH